MTAHIHGVSMNLLAHDPAWIKPRRELASNDTTELWMRYPPTGCRESIEKLVGRKITTRTCRDKFGNYRGVVFCINRPNLEVLRHVYELHTLHRYSSICRVDIAIDFQMADWPNQRRCFDWLEKHVVLNWRPRERRKFYDWTTYWLPWPFNKWNRNLVVYLKGENVVRLELRLQCSDAVKKAGLNTLDGLLSLNPNEPFQHHVRLVRLTEAPAGRRASRP